MKRPVDTQSWHPLRVTQGNDSTAEPLDELFSHDLQLSRWAVLGALAMMATFVVWAYAYSGLADRPPPDELSDPAFAAAAEPVCAEALREIDAMPGALDAVDNVERSAQVAASTAVLESMVDELDGLVSGPPEDQQMLTAWLADWRTYLADRYRYAEAVADDPGAPFLITDIDGPEALEKRIKRFAEGNQMGSCSPPWDIG